MALVVTTFALDNTSPNTQYKSTSPAEYALNPRPLIKTRVPPTSATLLGVITKPAPVKSVPKLNEIEPRAGESSNRSVKLTSPGKAAGVMHLASVDDINSPRVVASEKQQEMFEP
jgi:hypothetical protein